VGLLVLVSSQRVCVITTNVVILRSVALKDLGVGYVSLTNCNYMIKTIPPRFFSAKKMADQNDIFMFSHSLSSRERLVLVAGVT